jgi:hypothetical protein
VAGAPAVAAAVTPIPLSAGLAPRQVFAGYYRVVSALGRGGMGDVLRVDDLKLGQPAALKILPERLAHLPVAALDSDLGCDGFWAVRDPHARPWWPPHRSLGSVATTCTAALPDRPCARRTACAQRPLP